MPILVVILSKEIKAFEDYLNYLAKSIVTQPIKVKGKGKGLLIKNGVEVVAETVRIPKKRRSKTVIEETGQSEEVDTVDSEETKDDEEEPQLTRRIQNGVVISRAFHTESNERTLDHSKKLKMLKQCPGEGSGLALEVLDGPSGSSSSSSSYSKDSDGFLPTDDEARPNMSNDEKKQADSEKAEEEETGEEQPVDDQRKFNLPEAIDKFVQAHLKKTLPKDVPDFGKIKQEKAVKQSMPKYSTKLFDEASLKEYDQKDKLIKLMMKSKSYNTHPAHMKLYDALMDSLLDPSADADKETKKRKQKDSDASSLKKNKDKEESSKDDEMAVDAMPHDDDAPTQDRSKWFKQDVVVRPETPSPEWCKEPNAYNALEHPWFNEMVNAEKDPLRFDDLIGSRVDFTKFSKNCLKKDKLTKADLKVPAFKLLKGNYRNYIELEYNTEQCYLPLSDQIDWANPEGDRCPYDSSKPPPLQGPPRRTTILVDFFFNKDLECLKKGNTERKYAFLLTKPKAASIIRISMDKQFRYVYLKEIVVRRAHQKEYVFKETDFPNLHLNDIKDMYLLYVQNKLYHLKGDEQTDLVTALRFFIRRIILKTRVEDVQHGVGSYQTKLNITRPQVRCDNLNLKEPYTILHELRGVVYLNKNNGKYLMRADELYKFSDGTLKRVRDILNSRLHKFELGYNVCMPKRAIRKESFYVGKDRSDVAEKTDYDELKVLC
nr:hypothetical protein [Tanacetum cinerariifolium]